MNKTERVTLYAQIKNYAIFKIIIKFVPAEMNDFIPKSAEIDKYFYDEQTEITDTFHYETTL